MNSAYLSLLRPRQWLKNFLIFAPLFFGVGIFTGDKFEAVTLAFLAFSLVASAAYALNDIADRDRDGGHSDKKARPLASGAVTLRGAVAVLVSFFAAGMALSYFFVPQIFLLLFAYALLNAAYSLLLKRLVVVDIVVISIFYLMRITAGGMAADIAVSGWLVLCTLFASLFVIIGKRRAELMQEEGVREVLKSYNASFLDHALTVCTALLIGSYGIYTIAGAASPLVVYSNVFVMLGIFRYLFVIYTTDKAEFPERIILTDGVIRATVVAWATYMFAALYLFA